MSDVSVLATAKLVKPVAFDLRPDEATRSEIAARLDLLGLRKVSFAGEVAPAGSRDLQLEGKLGATVVQPCVVTGDPVTTRIDVPVVRRYLAEMEEPEGDEVEMPEDDSAEPLPASIGRRHGRGAGPRPARLAPSRGRGPGGYERDRTGCGTDDR